MRVRMRELRKQRGLSLEALGNLLGKSKQTMSGIERGKIGLDYDMAVQIAQILGGTPDEIFLPDRSNLILPKGENIAEHSATVEPSQRKEAS